MGSEWDLDDVATGHPKAIAELDELRDLLREARDMLRKARVREEKAVARAEEAEAERNRLLAEKKGGAPSGGLNDVDIVDAGPGAGATRVEINGALVDVTYYGIERVDPESLIEVELKMYARLNSGQTPDHY